MQKLCYVEVHVETPPRRPQDASKTAQDAPKTAQERSKSAQETPRTSQLTLKWSQVGSKIHSKSGLMLKTAKIKKNNEKPMKKH